MFNERTAARAVRSFLKKGLDSTAGPMLEVLRSRGLEGASVLEVGAGSGTALVSLAESGASRAIAFDISPAYETAARSLFEARSIDLPVEWHTGDFVAMADEVGAADVVFLNRVVCCYPDMDSLVDAAGSRTRRLLAAAYPRDRWPARLAFRAANVWSRLRGNSFRVFIHDPDSIASRAASTGLAEIASGMTSVWHWKVWERVAAVPQV